MDWIVSLLVVVPVAAAAGLVGRGVGRRRPPAGRDPVRTAWSAADEAQGIFLGRVDRSSPDLGVAHRQEDAGAVDASGTREASTRPPADGG